jgi:hypothetical protein
MITKDEYVENNNIESWKKIAELFVRETTTINNIPLEYSETRIYVIGEYMNYIPCITRWGYPGTLTKDWTIEELFESIKGGIIRYMNEHTTKIILHSVSVPFDAVNDTYPVFITFASYVKK